MSQESFRSSLAAAVEAMEALMVQLGIGETWETAQQLARTYLVPDLNNYVHLFFLGLAGFFVLRSIKAAAWDKGPERFSMNKVRARAVATKRSFTPKELVEFDGKDEATPVYMAIKGVVYDVSKSRHFYGPEGPYANFAGRDASRGLALTTFDKSVLADLDGPIDPLDDLDKSEQASLDEWMEFFAGKYTPVGTLIEPPKGAEKAKETEKETEKAAKETEEAEEAEGSKKDQ
ncbi:Dihydrodipicolinate synthase [Coemansia sp. RSA 552]|nr:Dihydrodipicolinate synthase [Coemansia sp. RSA 552]